MNSKSIDKYMRDIELLIPIKDSKTKRFLGDIRSSIEEYVEQHSDCTETDISAEFGSPKDIAMDYIESLDTDQLIRQLSTAKILRMLTAVVVVAVIVALSVFSYYQYRGYLDLKNSIISKEETIIEYGGSQCEE